MSIRAKHAIKSTTNPKVTVDWLKDKGYRVSVVQTFIQERPPVLEAEDDAVMMFPVMEQVASFSVLFSRPNGPVLMAQMGDVLLSYDGDVRIEE